MADAPGGSKKLKKCAKDNFASSTNAAGVRSDVSDLDSE